MCRVFAVLSILLVTSACQAQVEKAKGAQFLSVQSGVMLEENYNSLGFRTFFEYQKEVYGNWQLTASYEHTRHMNELATDHLHNVGANMSMLCGNAQYQFKIWKERVHWAAGFGFGAVHVNWDDQDKIGSVANANVTLNIKLTKKLYIETAPGLILVPFNRVYYSSLKVGALDQMFAYTAVPIGLKFKL